MRSTDGLEISGLSVAFGGNMAVYDVGLVAPLATITGLIGPNGAGKTTTFNACSGLVRPRAGTIRLFGTDVTTRSAAARARRGLGRTFQRVELCDTMTVRENVTLGSEARVAGNNAVRQILTTQHDRVTMRDATSMALERCGLETLAETTIGLLSTGQRRLVELARVLAAGFKLLLLDEPSSGLDDAETDAFGQILLGSVAELGVGILLVEHDMDLVMGICDYLYVLDFGQLIFEGTPAETRASDAVRAAYLGDDVAEVS